MVIMGNVNSLANKSDKFATLVKKMRTYSEFSLYFSMKTRLTTKTLNAKVDLSVFTTVRADRDTKTGGKCKGGLINNRWSYPGHVTVKITISSRDIEILGVSLRPYYMRRSSHTPLLLHPPMGTHRLCM